MNTLYICLTIIICLSILALLAIYFYNKSRYKKDDLTLFTSDLYKLKHKWSKMGKMDYSIAIEMVINNFNAIPDNPLVTAYAKNLFKEIKEAEEKIYEQ